MISEHWWNDFDRGKPKSSEREREWERGGGAVPVPLCQSKSDLEWPGIEQRPRLSEAGD